MKKLLSSVLVFLLVTLLSIGVCLAGDVPEALLYGADAQLYFGKVQKVSGDSLTILPVKVIKGELKLNSPITYEKGGHMMGGGNAQVGKTYLVGYVDENNLYLWITDGTDPKTLKIKNSNSMNLRLQDYLNNGDFEKAEAERQKKLAATASPATPAPQTPTASPSLSAAPTASPAPKPTPSVSPVSPSATSPDSLAVSASPPAGNQALAIALIAAFVVLAVFSFFLLKKLATKR